MLDFYLNPELAARLEAAASKLGCDPDAYLAETVRESIEDLEGIAEVEANPGERPPTLSAFHGRLLAEGKMSELPDSESDYDDPDDQPITIEGEPLSETVIRERQTLAEKAALPIWEVLDQLRATLPEGALDSLPEDGARQMDHYLYGSPKRPIT